MQPPSDDAKLVPVGRYRAGRNFVSVGDVIRVRASRGKRDGFVARVRAIRVDRASGVAAEVEVYGGRRGREMVRTFRPERIQRLARTRATAGGDVRG